MKKTFNLLLKCDVKTCSVLLFGSLMMALGINLFIAPHNLAFGGITGLTIIIESLTGIPLYISNAALSTIVILVGWKELGAPFMVKTLVPTAILPFCLFITKPFAIFTVSLPIAAIAGAILMGMGIGSIILTGGSTAGPDTIGLILEKRINLPVTTTMLVIDSTVILCGLRIYGVSTAVCSVIVSILINLSVKFTMKLKSMNQPNQADRKVISSGT